MADITAVLLAAGKGSRMKSTTPKALHKLANMPIIEHIIIAAKSVAHAGIHIVVSKDLEEHPQFLELREKYGFSHNIQHEQLGTAHALNSAPIASMKSKYILALCGDIPLIDENVLAKMAITADETESDVVVLGFCPSDPSGYGRLVCSSDDKLLKIVEQKDATLNELSIGLCNAGAMLIKREACIALLPLVQPSNAAKEFYLTDLIKAANTSGRKCTYIIGSEESALGINDVMQLAHAESVLQERLRKKMLESGVILVAPETIFFSADTIIGPGSKVNPYVVFGRAVKIASGTEILSFSHLEGTDIGESCTIGPFARLRPNTALAGNNSIGNFIELKNASISKGTKALHLSYIGDAELGERCNVGAGTIFCNFDGKQKHRSKIGNNVFIGSNTSIVSPVAIGDDAVVAAGSVVTEDIDENDLAIARSRQVNKKGRGRKNGS